MKIEKVKTKTFLETVFLAQTKYYYHKKK